MSLFTAILRAALSGEQLSPRISTSQNYKHWVSIEDFRRCIRCAENHGTIWLINDTPSPEPPIHPNCRCIIEAMKAIKAGTATIDHSFGADAEDKSFCLCASRTQRFCKNIYIKTAVWYNERKRGGTNERRSFPKTKKHTFAGI